MNVTYVVDTVILYDCDNVDLVDHYSIFLLSGKRFVYFSGTHFLRKPLTNFQVYKCDTENNTKEV